MNSHVVLLTRVDSNPHIGILTLNRPDVGNAINTPILETLNARLDEINVDKSIRVVILRSAGDHASFGADLSELVTKKGRRYGPISQADAQRHVLAGRAVAHRMFHLRVPMIGIPHGYCLGGGAEFYAMCDVLYGASGGREDGGLMYGFPEPTIGVMAGWMGPEVLMHRIDSGSSLDLLLTGRVINGEEALKLRIIQALYPKEELSSRAVEWAKKIASNAPLAIEATCRTARCTRFPNFDDELGASGVLTAENLMTQDFIKGATKILKKSRGSIKFNRQ